MLPVGAVEGRIIGVGTDMVAMERIGAVLDKPHGARFLQRVFTPAELALCDRRAGVVRTACLAKRFAAKEAIAKAMGTGFRDGIWLTDVEVLPDALGAPQVTLYGEAKAYMERTVGQGVRFHLSLSDEKQYALAFAIAEQLQQAPDDV
uniref:Holo-[acyl-carrier-protein] synthase n=1 Tax=Magnetococcus massalia (strain MO-1) TaxID=451514 RepID=A0A1S7LEJ1_MAGMO|nr:holo-[acyl-carrier-protein] synthase 1 [Candidatus Magnetococcus massalia]